VDDGVSIEEIVSLLEVCLEEESGEFVVGSVEEKVAGCDHTIFNGSVEEKDSL